MQHLLGYLNFRWPSLGEASLDNCADELLSHPARTRHSRAFCAVQWSPHQRASFAVLLLATVIVCAYAVPAAASGAALADKTPETATPAAVSNVLGIQMFRYTLLQEAVGHETLCRALRTLMNDPRVQPNCRESRDCRITAIDDSRHPRFELIPWESLPVSIDSPELRALSDYRAMVGGSGRETPGETWPDWYWRTQVKPEAEVGIKNGDLRLLKATFDVNNDGTRETMFRYDDIVCNPYCTVWHTVVDPDTLVPRLDVLRGGTYPIPIRFDGRTTWVGWESPETSIEIPKPAGPLVAYFQAWDLGAHMLRPANSFVIRPVCVLAVMEKKP